MMAGRTLHIAILAVLIGSGTYAQELMVSFSDPVGDHSGNVDLMDMTMTFDGNTGDYEIALVAVPKAPFNGSFRVNINLFNPDTGTTARDPAYFQDSSNDFDLEAPVLTLSLSGVNERLTHWDAGDRVAASTSILGNPDGTSLFRSSVLDLPITGCGPLPPSGNICDEDAIAFGDVEFIEGVPVPTLQSWALLCLLVGLLACGSYLLLRTRPAKARFVGG